MRVNYSSLPTEQRNPRTKKIDRKSIDQFIRIINREDASVARAVLKQKASLKKAIALISTSLNNQGRLFFIGAGTSGRLGVIEAAECPPTFNTPLSLVQAFMAGGKSAVFRSKEGAEDRGQDASRLVNKKLRANDVLVGIAASGVTAYVKEGLKAAKRKKAKTVLVTCHPHVSKKSAAVVIAVRTGPEVITGSTRLKAGTATKLVLNMLTVGSMIQFGKVYGNQMVDVQPRSKKLVARATRLISQIGRVSQGEAKKLLKRSKGQVKCAIVMARKKVNFQSAQKLLKKAQGRLHRLKV